MARTPDTDSDRRTVTVHVADADTLAPPTEHTLGAERRIASVGERLARTLSEVLEAVPSRPRGPVDLARTLGIDKVLASRLLKASRNRDPMAVTHFIPGPDPLRRVLRAASRRGVPATLIKPAEQAVNDFERLIRHEGGDRGGLDAIISAWLPEARKQFEIRRKQSAYKAMSQLKGASAETSIATVILHPSDDAHKLDVVWIFGLLGLQRLRPGAPVKFASRRNAAVDEPRHPTTLDGEPIEGIEGLRLDQYCSDPPAPLDVQRHGDVVHYVLAESTFGPDSATDLVFAEANFQEMDRYIPTGANRKGYVFAEVGTPVRTLLFDVFVHDDVYPGNDPELAIYDTSLDGVASVNDASRTIDRYDLAESIDALGRGTPCFRASEVPFYIDLIRDVFTRVGWDSERFRGYRCRIDYPIYGSQVAMMFDPPTEP